ncbi:MAG: hypothetical protein QOC77_283 [Thermoleophilaceae bacterium]|jgi:hypothetical protein|nr:hypothetical protein [Thermoleophilaceae bacterium]MEA2469596.1 hypothetical protein [Thermoleophilaceae bacterium]
MDEPRSHEDEAVEDLDVPEEDAEGVKGGYLKLGQIKGESADDKHKDW